MQIHYHGGLCCGVKTITGFYSYPSCTALGYTLGSEHIEYDEYDEYEDLEDARPDLNGSPVNSDWNFFIGNVPYETYEERFKRFVDYIRELRPGGVVEIVLTSGQLDNWGEIIKKAGFVQYVPTFTNSNSGAKLHMYHLVMEDE